MLVAVDNIDVVLVQLERLGPDLVVAIKFLPIDRIPWAVENAAFRLIG